MLAQACRAAALLALLALATPVVAEPLEHFVFPLSGELMVPPTSSPVVGSADLIYDPETTSLSGFVLFGNLRGDLTSLQIHGPAGATERGPLLADLGATRHILMAGMVHTQIAWLLQEQLYVEVHTSAFPDGEERGQILREHSAVDSSTWTAIRALFR